MIKIIVQVYIPKNKKERITISCVAYGFKSSVPVIEEGEGKMKLRKILCIALSVMMVGSLTACGTSQSEQKETKKDDASADKAAVLNIAYQYGIAYAPAMIAQKNKTIEKRYKDATGKEVTVNWIQMSSGADINTGIASDELNVGFMGVGPAITGVAKKVGYKIFTNVSGQEHGMMVNDDSKKSLKDIVGSDAQISVVNIGSFQHIILAMALDAEGEDPHALDSNLIAMKHPDGMTSLETGSVLGHVTTSPYIYQEQKESKLHSIDSVKNAWSKENSFIVGVASEKLHSENPELYKALCDGISDAMQFISDNVKDAAAITYEADGSTQEEEQEYLKKGYYSPETKGIKKMADFMYKNKFVDEDPGAYEDIVFDNVKGD